MLFKKKGMIDISELQRRGRIIIPDKDVDIPTDKEGFVDLRKHETRKQTIKTPVKKSFSFFNNIPAQTSTPSPTQNFSTETEGYNKREVDEKITELDNKVYKLEQRIELLERKAGVSSSSPAPINW